MELRVAADECEDVAVGFSMFRGPLPQHAIEITEVISDYYAIISLLSTLDALARDSRYRRNWPRVQEDADLVRTCLKYTNEDILDLFGNLDGADAHPERFNLVWTAMKQFFWDETQYSFATRLGKYKAFLRELGDIMRENHGAPFHAGLRNNIKTLLAAQKRRRGPLIPCINPDGNPSSSNSRRAEPFSPVNDRRPRRRSYERMRPSNLSPQSPVSPGSGPSDLPPSAPDAPTSPLTTSTSGTTNTSRSTRSDVQNHWIKSVFTSYGTGTSIPKSSERAGCFGALHRFIKHDLREQGFEKLLQVEFTGDSGMTVYFWLRPRDDRVRIVCKVSHRIRPSDWYCLPLNLLEILRNGSTLLLCRRRHSGRQLVLWACLKFSTFESMIIFFCTFLALRAQDRCRPVENIRDWQLELEEELYGGQIIDDRYLHALRVFQDTTSGAVRLQGSIHNGPSDHTPVWTAFVTQHIRKRGWLRQVDSRTVLVRELKPSIFMSAEFYEPPKTSRGEHILKFASLEDTEEFLAVMDEIALNMLRSMRG